MGVNDFDEGFGRYIDQKTLWDALCSGEVSGSFLGPLNVAGAGGSLGSSGLSGAVVAVPFAKLNASGNDFILIFVDEKGCVRGVPEAVVDASFVRKICDRRRGVGCDQLFAVSSVEKNTLTLQIFNQDGSKAANCGNGMRAVGGFFLDANREYKECLIKIEYNDDHRLVRCVAAGPSLVEVDMGEVLVQDDEEGLPVYNVGNLHKVCLVDHNGSIADIEDVDDVEMVRPDEVAFFVPEDASPHDKYNINYVRVVRSGGDSLPSNPSVVLTTVERGVGLTDCCGSGSCASVAHCVAVGLVPLNEPVRVITKGSRDELLTVRIQNSSNELPRDSQSARYRAWLMGGYQLNHFGYFAL